MQNRFETHQKKNRLGMKIACLYPLNVMYVFFFFKVYPFYIIKKMVAM